jgi:DNA-binding MarR family transcriptional regulator
MRNQVAYLLRYRSVPTDATPYRFGDLLALARRSWVLNMASGLEARGFADYRASDAGAVRLLLRGPTPVGQIGAVLGTTRQAARKVARGLEERGYAITGPDPDDGRKVNVTLTARGRAYAEAIITVIDALNRNLASKVDPVHLAHADAVLRTVVYQERLVANAERIPPPPEGVVPAT